MWTNSQLLFCQQISIHFLKSMFMLRNIDFKKERERDWMKRLKVLREAFQLAVSWPHFCHGSHISTPNSDCC